MSSIIINSLNQSNCRNYFSVILLCVSVSLWLIVPFHANAQIRPVYDQGALGLGRLLKRLNTSASVMMIGAHPDDEDTALLTYLARGENARTAYLSLTRGDGGQNIIGPELGESLGVIRTEELLQARKLDGAEQYFTRAYDFGFSKTLDEAKQKWDEKIILCDAVRVIRNFRPLVVVSQFSGTPADGHGQHQYAGYISPLAVKASADATQCKDAGEVWQVKKFYVRHRGTGEPTLRINTGKYDPLLGRSYFEIAMEARSQHRSQEQGVLELKGEQYSGLNLVGGDTKETGIFEGIKTSNRDFIDLKSLNNTLVSENIDKIHDRITSAINRFKADNPSLVLIDLRLALEHIHSLKNSSIFYDFDKRQNKPFSLLEPGYFDLWNFLTRKEADLVKALRLASNIQLDVLVFQETVVPGDEFPVFVRAFSPSKGKIVEFIQLHAPDGWIVSKFQEMSDGEILAAGFTRERANDTFKFVVTIPKSEKLTQPYWLQAQRTGELFRFPNGEDSTLPFAPPLITADFGIRTEIGDLVTYSQSVEYRYADDTRGEIRRNVVVVPSVSVEVDQSLLIVPFSNRSQSKQVALSITNQSNKPVSGAVSLKINSGADWKYTASSSTFDLKKSGEKTTIVFDVTIPAGTKPGSYQIVGNAMIGETIASSTMHTIAYPHIQTHRFYRPAATAVNIFDLKVTPARIGYIAGSGDQIPEAIRQIGLGVELLDEKYLSSGNLSKFDVIVAGIRVSEVRPDFAANNQRLLDWVNKGGTLIVQYQRPVYAQQNLMPLPAQMGPRVSDENAKVTILQPAHPIFNTPNKITDADFEGWVQERNLYNFSTMDEKYTGLLESHDAGEAENKGGLVVADIGKGKYVYCSYSLFRQLPAGVPGAYRLLANMLSFRGVKGKKALTR
jgi:LmbE family N-acetylglucosaminyl deacetylase